MKFINEKFLYKFPEFIMIVHLLRQHDTSIRTDTDFSGSEWRAWKQFRYVEQCEKY